MTIHDKNLPRALKAIKAAGEHFRTKDGSDPFEMLTKKVGDMTDATLKRIGETEGKVDGLQATVDTLAQKMARGSGGEEVAPETWGAEFIRKSGDAVREMASNRNGRVGLNVKAFTVGDASGAALDMPVRDATNLLPKRRLTIRNLLPVVSIGTGTVEYVQQATRPTGAAAVAEGALKPESSMTFSLETTTAKVIAHWIKASKQALEDLPQLRDLIDTEMRYGLLLAEEAQILSGDGTGANLDGLIPNATAYSAPFAVGSENMIDKIGLAILQSALADFPADGIVVHPSDWVRMRLLKDGDGKYLLGDPQAAVAPSLFGLPVVPTQAMTIDKFLVGSFASAATLYDRWAPRVEVGYVDDDFTRNYCSLLIEERVALAVKNPLALTYGDFGNVA